MHAGRRGVRGLGSKNGSYFLFVGKNQESGNDDFRTCKLHTLKLMEKLDQKHVFNAFVKCLQVVKLHDCTGAKGVEALEGSRF